MRNILIVKNRREAIAIDLDSGVMLYRQSTGDLGNYCGNYMTIRPTDKITSIVINGEFQSYSYLGRTYKIPNAVEPVGFTPTKEETKRLFKLTRDYADEERPVEKTQEDRVRVIQNRMYSWSDRSRVGTGRAEPVNWLSEAGRRTVVQFLKDFDGEKD